MPYLLPTQIALNIEPVAKRGRVDKEYLKCKDVASIYKTPSWGKIFTPSLLKLLLKAFVRTICVSAENIQPKTLSILLSGVFVWSCVVDNKNEPTMLLKGIIPKLISPIKCEKEIQTISTDLFIGAFAKWITIKHSWMGRRCEIPIY